MAAHCPKCGTAIVCESVQSDKLYLCPSCGTGLKITLDERIHWSFWLLPPIIDVLCLLLISLAGYRSPNITAVAVAQDAPPSFQPPPDKIAFNEMLAAAKTGDAASQYAMGKAYEEGRWIAEDDDNAFEWFRKSAEQGHTDAQLALGGMYFSGRGTRRNYQEAYFWYKLAANAGKSRELAVAARRCLPRHEIAAVEKRVSNWSPAQSAQNIGAEVL